MLKSRYLASVSDELVKLYAQLEQDIKIDMGKRIAFLMKIDDDIEYQAELLNQTGALKKDVVSFIAKYNADAEEIVKAVFDKALKKASENDMKFIKVAQRELSENQTQIIQASVNRFLNADKINKTFDERKSKYGWDATYRNLERMTLTVADASQTSFLRECNRAYMKVSTGAFSHQDAFLSAVDTLCDEGVYCIHYSGSGIERKFSVESAVRMNILTGVNQTASQQTLQNCETVGTDLVEVDAHLGARPEHEAWQGKVYCLDGERDYVDENGDTQHALNFYDVCRPGDADGICGINCRHSYYPYFEGTERLYSNGELDEMADKKVTYTDSSGKEKTVTSYEAEQRMRYMENQLRKYKTRTMTEDAAGLDSSDSRAKAREWSSALKKFASDTGFSRDTTREYVGKRV